MNSFSIDFYVWQPEINEWLWVPSACSATSWPGFPGISRAGFLSSTFGVGLRVDDVLSLGCERDGFSLAEWVQALTNTMNASDRGTPFARLSAGGRLSFQIYQGLDEDVILLSRTSTVDNPTDYIEETARRTGTYYQDFPVPRALWDDAVRASLGGLGGALRRCPPSKIPQEHVWIEKLLMEIVDRW
jgi:hypothetical protein